MSTLENFLKNKIIWPFFLYINIVTILIVFICYFLSFSLENKSRTLFRDRAVESLKNPIILGSHLEVKSRILSLNKEFKDYCIDFHSVNINTDFCKVSKDKLINDFEIINLMPGQKLVFNYSWKSFLLNISTTIFGVLIVFIFVGYIMLRKTQSVALRLSDEIKQIYNVEPGLSFSIEEFKQMNSQYNDFLKIQCQSIENKTRTDYARKIVHDICSPLETLNIVSEKVSIKNDELVVFQKALRRLNEISSKLLDNTRVDQGKEDYDFLEIVKEVLDEKKQAKDFDYELSTNDVTIVKIDKVELGRILSNLINNGIEAARLVDRMPFIKIMANKVGDKLEIKIQDNGSGIADQVLKKLGNDEITTKANGNGIGFKSASEIIKSWGGVLEVEETSENGTKIRIILQNDKNEINKINNFILLDDDELTRLTWEMRARSAGVSLKTYMSISELRKELNNHSKEDCFYIDSDLGDIPGEEFARELHFLGFKNISVCSGYTSEKFKKYDFLRGVISKKPPF